jgi:hypothetical protein
LKRVLRFYVPLLKEELIAIWAKQKALARNSASTDLGLAEDERVEDAGLEDEEPSPLASHRKIKERVAA